MLVKVQDGFYLNTAHIIAVRVSKNMMDHSFLVDIAYTPDHAEPKGRYQKKFKTQIEANAFLQQLHQKTV